MAKSRSDRSLTERWRNRTIFEERTQRLRHAETIADRKLIDEVPGVKQLLARLMHLDGAYPRSTGVVQLEHFCPGNKGVSDHGTWELMCFGRTRTITTN